MTGEGKNGVDLSESFWRKPFFVCDFIPPFNSIASFPSTRESLAPIAFIQTESFRGTVEQLCRRKGESERIDSRTKVHNFPVAKLATETLKHPKSRPRNRIIAALLSIYRCFLPTHLVPPLRSPSTDVSQPPVFFLFFSFHSLFTDQQLFFKQPTERHLHLYSFYWKGN